MITEIDNLFKHPHYLQRYKENKILISVLPLSKKIHLYTLNKTKINPDYLKIIVKIP